MDEEIPLKIDLTATVDNGDESASDDDLKIDLDASTSTPNRDDYKDIDINNLDAEAQRILECIENTIAQKAEKANLTAINVKSIIRHVVGNEHVLELVRQNENPDTGQHTPIFEPTLTRAKVRELYPDGAAAPLPLLGPAKSPSAVDKFIAEDLAEDSSGDEYIPVEEGSEDDHDTQSEPGTPQKAASMAETAEIVTFSEDGVFKLPPVKSPNSQKQLGEHTQEEDTNIARRTRSKLSLSSTPLEVIEVQFIPPDITTDMYDMDCDDEDWKDFLTKFVLPLEDVVKPSEEDEQDPEYNILEDLAIETADREELRQDKAVKIPKKELKALMAELAEYVDVFNASHPDQSTLQSVEIQCSSLIEDALNSTSPQRRVTRQQVAPPPATTTNVETISVGTNSVETNGVETNSVETNSVETNSVETNGVETNSVETNGVETNGVETNGVETNSVKTVPPTPVLQANQIILLEQQLRQHVQILTQNFLLTYENPEFHSMSLEFKGMLMYLSHISNGVESSQYHACNLPEAVQLVSDWETKFGENDAEVQNTKIHVAKVLREGIDSKLAGREYIPQFPPLLLRTISNSTVFLYPALLPIIPFKSSRAVPHRMRFCKSEDELIAIGLDQFTPLLKDDYASRYRKNEVQVRVLAKYISEFMMPMKQMDEVVWHIRNIRNRKDYNNPINYFYQHGKAPLTYHYVIGIEYFGIKPPKERDKTTLPYLWKTYIYGEGANTMGKKNSGPIKQLPAPPLPLPLPNNNANETTKTPQLIQPQYLLTPIGCPPSRPVARNLDKSLIVAATTVSDCPQFFSTPKANRSTPIAKRKRLDEYYQLPTHTYSFSKHFGVDCLSRLRFNSSIFARIRDCDDLDMLPNMPSLANRHAGASTSTSTSEQQHDDPSHSTEGGSDGVVATQRVSIEENGDCRPSTSQKVYTDIGNEVNLVTSTSSTKAACNKKMGNERKKTKYRRDHATLAMLSPQDPKVTQERAQSYAQAYFDKAKEKLAASDYTQFMEILTEFQEKSNSVSELYKKMELVLDGKHSDLLEEFVTFFTPIQAQQIGKMTLYLVLSNMSLFLRNLEIYFKEQPAQLRKIFRCLSELANYTNITMEKVKNTILPLLKGNKLLTDWFLQIFPNEPPTQSLLNGQWETIEIPKEFNKIINDAVESVAIPESRDEYGGRDCICACHQEDDPLLKQPLRHCIPCGTKFLQGRVYVQTGKAVRPANVRFNEDQKDRLGCPSNNKKKKFRKNPSKSVSSPTKDDDHRTGMDSDDEECLKRKSRSTRSPRKKKLKTVDSEEKTAIPSIKSCDSNCTNIENVISVEEKVEVEVEDEVIDNSVKDVEQKETEDVAEWDCNTSMESVELKLTPEQSAESDSDCGEMSSQDNNTETDESGDEAESLTNSPIHSDGNSNDEVVWTKEEDKTILEIFQSQGDKEETFLYISNQLQNKSVEQVKQRFKVLMDLLQEMVDTSQSID